MGKAGQEGEHPRSKIAGWPQATCFTSLFSVPEARASLTKASSMGTEGR
jgi:hypothetical protein